VSELRKESFPWIVAAVWGNPGPDLEDTVKKILVVLVVGR
jgi:hypothetical protein